MLAHIQWKSAMIIDGLITEVTASATTKDVTHLFGDAFLHRVNAMKYFEQIVYLVAHQAS